MASPTQSAERLIADGNRAENEGRVAQACEAYRAAVRAAPHHAPAHLNLAIGLEAGGDLDGALACYERALELDRENVSANYNLGRLLCSRGDDARGERLLRLALKSRPDLPEAHVVLSGLHERRGDLAAAAAELQEALAHRPDYAGARLNYSLLLQHMGNVLADRGKLEEAALRYREALVLKPDLVEAQYSLCLLLNEQGQTADAITSLRELLARNPAFAPGHVSLGNLLGTQASVGAAAASLQQAIALDPRLAKAHIGLGDIHRSLDQIDEAVLCYETALSIEPENIDARWSVVLSHLRAVYDTDAAAAQGHSGFGRGLEELDRRIDEPRLGTLVEAVGNRTPFYIAYHEENNREPLRRHGALCSRVMARWLEDHAPPASPRARRRGVIRVGVVSAHFYNHSVWNALARGWFQHLDRGRFELDAFSLGATADEETALARSLAAHFEHGHGRLERWVEAIASRAPDVLLYPEVWMNSPTAQLAALRLAPVQVASWGHPQTTGLPTMDYFLSAEEMEPAEAQAHYSEKLVPLSHLGCSFPSPRLGPAAHDLRDLGITTSALLVCPGTPFKYAPRHDRVFPEIARRLGECRFVFFNYHVPQLSDKLHQRLRAAFAAHGLDADKFVSFVPWQSPERFRGLLAEAHVFLDTIGFSGFNTAMQAVECGLPIVTREGRFMRGRFASGILGRLGLRELVADSDDGYVELAVRVCQDSEYRRHLRKRIAAQRSVLYDDPAPVRALEEFLARAVAR
jgi:predicted O-linked N-acetylglucosamine transferase (SPINDLY family)